MTPKPESETDHEQAIRDYYAHCDQAEHAEAAELPPVPNIIAALDTGTATPELISEWANHPYVCTTDIIRRAIAALLAARAAEAAQHRQALERLTRQAQDISVTLGEAGCRAMPIVDGVRWLVDHNLQLRARLAAVEAERDKAIAENIRLTNAEIEALRAERDRLKAAAQAVLDNPACSDPDCCGTAFKHQAALQQLTFALTPQGQSTDGETR